MNRRVSPPLWVWIALLGLGVAVRALLIAPVFGRPLDDPDQYLVLARSLAAGQGLSFEGRPTAYRPPLYPLLLVPGIVWEGPEPRCWIFGLNLALGALAIGLTGVAARRWGFGSGPTLLSMAVVAIDPVLAAQSRVVMTETLAAMLAAAALASVPRVPGRRWFALAGIWIGLGALCRPSLLPAVLVLAILVVVRAPADWRERLRCAGVLMAGCLLMLLPWGIRNQRVLGEPIVTTTHGGYTLALANNEVYYDEVLNGPPGAVWSGPNQYRWFLEINRRCAGPTEPASDRLYYREGWRIARERPGDFARASLARLGRLWALAPAPGVYPAAIRLATLAWTAPFWILVLSSFVRRTAFSWPVCATLAFLLSLSLVHAVYWTDMRMRAPLVPALALLAASSFPKRHDDPCQAVT